MKVVSWNVNGIRAAATKGLHDWLSTSSADVVGLQETRATLEQVPTELRAQPGWHFHLSSAERKGYSGVGLWSRAAPDEVRTSLGDPEYDAEGRVQLARFGRLWIANVYFPNGSGTKQTGGQRENGRVPFKLDFYRALFDKLNPAFKAGEPVLVMGDFNTAHREIDLARPKQNQNTSGFLPEEREELDRWIKAGWVDTFRHIHGDVEGKYTWWSQRFNVRAKNIGWRIDYVLASPGAMEHITDAFILSDVMGSDHCPIGVELDRAIIGA